MYLNTLADIVSKDFHIPLMVHFRTQFALAYI